MKKFIVCIIAIIILIFIVVILKGIKTTKYSHSDIVELINKGTQSMDNVSFYKEEYGRTRKYYFKGDKWKEILSPDSVRIILENEKIYMIDKEAKEMTISDSSFLKGKRGLQEDALNIEKLNKDVVYNDAFRYEFQYIRDEKLEDKDCIFVKERVYYIETKKYIDNSRGSENEVPVYWIEKSTGFVIGSGLMESGKSKATPDTIIKNIKCGEVTDDIFNDMFTLPDDYNVFEFTDKNTIKKVK